MDSRSREFVSFGTRYSLVLDNVELGDEFYEDLDGDGPGGVECSPRLAGRYLCDELGKRVTSSIGYSLAFDNTNGIRATRGQRMVLSQDFAGLGGDIKYIRTRGDATKYWGLGGGFILSAHGEGGYIHPLQDKPSEFNDAVRLTDRFFGPQMRGFDIRGIGPRIRRVAYVADGDGPPVLDDDDDFAVDAIGGRAYYMGRIELELPPTSAMRSLGLRPSAFVDVGSVWKLTKPELLDDPGSCAGARSR